MRRTSRDKSDCHSGDSQNLVSVSAATVGRSSDEMQDGRVTDLNEQVRGEESVEVGCVDLDQTPGVNRPLCEILCTPIIVVSVISATTAMFVMTLVMSASTLAMRDHFGYPIFFATSCIQLHIVCMFAPGFFTGSLMNSMGKLNTIFCGNLLLAISLIIGLLGHTKSHFVGVLAFLGVRESCS